MRVSWAIPCRFAEVLNGAGNMLGVGTDTFWFAELPQEVHLAVMVNIVVPEHQLETEETLLVDVLDPQLETIFHESHQVLMSDYASRPPGREPSSMNVLGITFPVASYGQYTVSMRIDGRTTSIALFAQPAG